MGPYFQNILQHRKNKKLATNVVITGEAGIGKSYLATDLCRYYEGRKTRGEDRFTIDQVVFHYSGFMELVLSLKAGKAIVFDEPSYAMGKREWYKELNQALVQTIESFRFKMHPLIIPIINKSLLDKTIRDHLIQYQINVTARGQATVYRLKPSQFQERIYHTSVIDLHYKFMDNDLCNRPSCLGCEKVVNCHIFRAQYERKKAAVQESRYEQAKDRAAATESKMLTLLEYEDLALKIQDQWFVDERIHVQKLRIALKDHYNVNLSRNKAYLLKTQLETHHPELAV